MEKEFEILKEAKNEIVELRRILELQTAKVQTMEIFACALGLKLTIQPMKPDVVWKIQKYLDENGA